MPRPKTMKKNIQALHCYMTQIDPPRPDLEFFMTDVAAELGHLAVSAFDHELTGRDVSWDLRDLAAAGSRALLSEGASPEVITKALEAEWEHAQAKHPGRTLDCDGIPSFDRFAALAEEVGESFAALTYDNQASTGHGSSFFNEMIQVIGLALAWEVYVNRVAR